MVAVFHIVVNIGAYQLFFKRVRYIDIIDAPAFVLRAHGGEALAPPGVTVRFGMKFAEAVCPPGGIKLIHPCTFFGQEAG